MVLKKKKPVDVQEATHERQHVVTQVVEVVEENEESTPQEAHETIQEAEEKVAFAEPPSKHEQFVHSESSFVDRPLSTESAAREDRIPEDSEERQKKTVAELFKRPTPMIMAEITMHKEVPRKKNKIFLIVIVILLLMLLGGGLFVAKRKSGSLVKMFAPVPTPTPTSAPTPTPQPVNRGDIKIQILNGGGVPGAASKMKSLLEDKGWKIADVSNADVYTYDKTEVHVQSGKEAYQKLLIDDLKDTYSLATNTASLSSDVQYDARVIVGKQ